MDCLRELNMVSMILRIVLAILIGGIIGMDRGKKHSPAGLRTNILVCLGATMVMMTNQYVYATYHVSDPVRLGAQVISGIGFLGAGTIMVTGKTQIKGLTTAAGLWTAACSGLAIGIGFYEGAILGSFAILFTISGLCRFDNWVHKHSKYIEVYIEYSENRSSFTEFLQYIKDNNFVVVHIQTSREGYIHKENEKQRTTGYILSLKSSIKRNHMEMIDVLTVPKGIEYIEEL